MLDHKSPVGQGNDSTKADRQSTGPELTKPPAISLPKGGGAIRGIGEKFAANPVTGTGSMTIPIATSPGRSGFGPQLSLSYDSGAGNGPFGLGWNLSLPAITRKTDKGLPRYNDADESDVFILSGAEDLVPVLNPDGSRPEDPTSLSGHKIRRYRPRIEGLFARIERWTNSEGISHWRSISKDNITTLYGATAESRIVDSTDATRIFSWLICESFDDKGNAIRYEYKKENSEGIDRSTAHESNRQDIHRATNSYLKRIKYGNKTPHQSDENLSERTDWMFEAVFDYGEHYLETNGDVQVDYTDDQREWDLRLDPFSSYRSGFEVRTYRLCQRVLMFHHFESELGTPDYLVRATHFEHRKDPVASFIQLVTQSGYKRNEDETYRKKSLPPVEFTYSKAIIKDEVYEVDPASLENLPQGLDNSRYQWVDLDGEGLSGLLTEQGEAWFYKRNQSAVSVKDAAGNMTTPARFAPLELVATIPSSANLAGGQQLLDLAGDGQLDVVEFDGPAPGFFERTADEDWETHRSFSSLPNISWRDPNLKFIDLTGDGHADILITEDDAFSWYPSLAEAGFGPGEKVRQAIDEEHGPRLVFADGTQSIYLADMSGDGLTDLVRIRNGEVCYWPNLGYARFGAKVIMDQSPWFDAPDMFDQRRIRLADIDGSGLVDILYLTGQGVQIYLNQSGNSWREQPILSTFPRIDNLSAVSTVDLLGNGTACLVWSSPLPGDARSTIRYIDLMGGKKPHLLIGTKNNLGAETEITYAPSTQFYLQDKQAGKPWITKLPFPVHCVEKVTVTDKWRQTKFSSTYSYHHGYFDGIEREFRGFGRVEQVDVESYGEFGQGNIASPYITNDKTLYQPPIKTITWYHTGAAIDRERILTQFVSEYFPAHYSSDFEEKALPEPELPADLSADEWREALRACKGMVLRQESYELDVDLLHAADPKDVPVRIYSAATHNCQIQQLQPRGENKHAVFLVTESEALSYQYELVLPKGSVQVSPDPRIAHTLNLSFDDYGRALQSVAVVYPRLVPYTDPSNILEAEQLALIQKVQSERHIAYTETHFTYELPDNPDLHRLPAPCEALTYELNGADPAHGFVPSSGLYFTINDFKSFNLTNDLPGQGIKPVIKLDYQQQPTNKKAHMRIIDWVRILYFKDDLSGPLDSGRQSYLGLTYETYKLALTEVLLTDVLNEKFDASVRAALNKDSTSIWTQAEAGFLVSGYQTDSELFRTNASARQWWMRSGIAGFADDAADHFYLPEEYTDPFGNKTTLVYDKNYDLFIQSSTDALGNTSGVAKDQATDEPRFDYRVLAPIEMVDPNGNHAEVYFDIRGRVVASAVKGKGDGTEGDDLNGFDDILANPSAAEVQAFCTASDMDVDQAEKWLRRATARFVYHFGEDRDKQSGAFLKWEGRPPGACGIVREIHVHATGGGASPLQVSLECSDGSGNVLMKKVQAEPALGQTGLRWIINGLTVLNNKDKPVKQYEPSFSKQGFGCEPPPAEGVTPILYYDAAGRVIRTEMPDGTFSRVEFSPWHVKTFDANDTVLESRWYQDRGAPDPQASLASGASPDTRAAWVAAQHANTPSENHLDSLGREVIAIAHNRTKGVDEKYLTFTKLDAEGKPLWIRDARGNLVMQYITPARPNNATGEDMPANAVPCYDIAGNLLFQRSMDAGDRWMLMDAAGKPMLAWDLNDKGAGSATQQRFYRTDYDELHRPTAQWQTIDSNPPALIEAFDYLDTDSFKNPQGVVDKVALTAARAKNLIGQAIRHWDPSGLANLERLDLSGQPAHITRTLIKLTADNNANGVLNWDLTDRSSLLEDETFIQLTEYDALGRMTTLYNWHRDITFAADGAQQATPGLTNRVAVYVPEYNERGVLNSEWLHVRASKSIASNGKPAFKADTTRSKQAIVNIRYNAKGQKLTLELENRTTTTYSYDKETFRLVTLKTERSVSPKGVQDLHYTYDPVGNITYINDAAQEVVYFNQSIIRPEHNYVYDALYRLIEATGRENPNSPAPPLNKEGAWPQQPFPTNDQPHNYTQYYTYDEVGNFLTMQHSVPTNNAASWTRRYEPHQDSNRLYRTWYNAPDWDHAASDQRTEYRHDTHGNMLNLNQTPEDWGLDIRWDWRDMIRGFDCIGGGIAQYHYGIDKQRTRKHITRNGGGVVEDRIYLGGYELYRRTNPQSEVVEEIESHHLFEGEQRVLLVDDVITAKSSAQPGPNELSIKEQTLFRYQYSNHLGSACLELDHQAEIISYEEYHPYGTSAYRAMKNGIEAPAKRYRFTGMERDEESGLSYHTARYYLPWLARWTSNDIVLDKHLGSLYAYVHSNPVRFLDPNGKYDWEMFKADVKTGIKKIPEGLMEPLAVVSDLSNMSGRVGLYLLLGITSDEIDNSPQSRFTPMLTNQSATTKKIEGGQSGLRAGLTLATAGPSLGAVPMIDSWVTVFDKNMSADEATSYLVQGATQQVVMAGIAKGAQFVDSIGAGPAKGVAEGVGDYAREVARQEARTPSPPLLPPSAGWATLDGKPVPPTGKATVYTGKSVDTIADPMEIGKSGFKTSGTNRDLVSHKIGDDTQGNSALQGSTENRGGAARFAADSTGERGFVFKIFGAEFWDVAALTYGKFKSSASPLLGKNWNEIPYSGEVELTISGTIPGEMIEGWWPVENVDGKIRFGDFVSNPYFNKSP